jgi:hypothetical protein
VEEGVVYPAVVHKYRLFLCRRADSIISVSTVSTAIICMSPMIHCTLCATSTSPSSMWLFISAGESSACENSGRNSDREPQNGSTATAVLECGHPIDIL